MSLVLEPPGSVELEVTVGILCALCNCPPDVYTWVGSINTFRLTGEWQVAQLITTPYSVVIMLLVYLFHLQSDGRCGGRCPVHARGGGNKVQVGRGELQISEHPMNCTVGDSSTRRYYNRGRVTGVFHLGKRQMGGLFFVFFFGREKLGACSDENELLPLFDHEEQEPVSLGYLLVSCSLSWFPMLFPFDFLPPCQSGIGPYHSALKEDLLEVVLEG